jgi:hypothetical protein
VLQCRRRSARSDLLPHLLLHVLRSSRRPLIRIMQVCSQRPPSPAQNHRAICKSFRLGVQPLLASQFTSKPIHHVDITTILVILFFKHQLKTMCLRNYVYNKQLKIISRKELYNFSSSI